MVDFAQKSRKSSPSTRSSNRRDCSQAICPRARSAIVRLWLALSFRKCATTPTGWRFVPAKCSANTLTRSCSQRAPTGPESEIYWSLSSFIRGSQCVSQELMRTRYSFLCLRQCQRCTPQLRNAVIPRMQCFIKRGLGSLQLCFRFIDHRSTHFPPLTAGQQTMDRQSSSDVWPFTDPHSLSVTTSFPVRPAAQQYARAAGPRLKPCLKDFRPPACARLFFCLCRR
jgi:hypothetical protein